jgi:hypothetical protein
MDLTEQYLDNVYDCFLQEQLKILQGIKSGSTEHKATTEHRQISLLTSLMCNVLKLRDLKRKLTADL